MRILSFVLVSFLLLFLSACGVTRPSVESAYSRVIYAHSGSEISCSHCHESKRPITSGGFLGLNLNTPFDYTTHAQEYDCFECHNSSSKKTRSKADWAGGSFSHSGVSTCIQCHSSQSPTSDVTYTLSDGITTSTFSHASSGQGECVSCHNLALLQILI